MKFPSDAQRTLADALEAGARAEGVALVDHVKRVARRLGVSWRTLYRVARAELPPKLLLAFAIEDEFPAVRVDEWRPRRIVRSGNEKEPRLDVKG